MTDTKTPQTTYSPSNADSVLSRLRLANIGFADSFDTGKKLPRRLPGPAADRREAPLGSDSQFCVQVPNLEQVQIDRRKIRYQRQSACSCLLWGVNSKAGANLGETVGKCQRSRTDTLTGVVVESDGETARFGNLMICRKFWICPHCAARMSEQDKRRLNRVMVKAQERGWLTVLVTYTMRHNRGDDLPALLDVNATARRWMKSGSRFSGDNYPSIRKRFGIVAGVINLEVTFGDENAWHPHNHEILFIDPALIGYEGETIPRRFWDDLRQAIARRWREAVRRAGGDCDLRRGVSLKQGDSAVSDYIAKFGHDPARTWSIESEIAKSPAKVAKGKKGRSPFQLLADYTEAGDKRAGALFVEYARCFDAKHHLHGLTDVEKLLGIDDDAPAADGDTAENEKPAFFPVIELPPDNVAWRLLCRAEKRADLLAAAVEGFAAVCDLLASVGYQGAPPLDLREAAKISSGAASHIAGLPVAAAASPPAAADNAPPLQIKLPGMSRSEGRWHV